MHAQRLACLRQLVDRHAHFVDLPLQTRGRINARHVQQHQPLKARIAHARHVQVVTVATPLGTVVHMEVARTNTQVGNIVGNLATHVKGHAPIERLNFLGPDLSCAACVLAARQAQCRQRLRTADHVLDGADLLNMPVVHHADTLTQAACLVDVVAHVEHGAVADIEQVEHVLLEGALKIGIERAHGLVEHKDARMRRHHTGKCHALLLPARKARGVAVGKIG